MSENMGEWLEQRPVTYTRRVSERLALDEHQKTLLATLVEAARRGTKQRSNFGYVERPPGSLPSFEHPGLRSEFRMSVADIEAFQDLALLRHRRVIAGSGNIELLARAFDAYDHMRLEDQSAAARVEQAMHAYLNGEDFRLRYSGAYEAWTHAARLLWSDEAARHTTTIGHLCREAMQEFAAVVAGVPPGAADPEKANTVGRVRRFIDQIQSSGTREFCEALLAYWGTVSDLVQRQEHGGQKEGEALVWEDARRVVFQTGNVMFELAAVSRPKT